MPEVELLPHSAWPVTADVLGTGTGTGTGAVPLPSARRRPPD
ncbi:hypothetical protein [Sphaerisporangium perillae]|nr:hypothetical protein [Sphaerisporangium perillae]